MPVTYQPGILVYLRLCGELPPYKRLSPLISARAAAAISHGTCHTPIRLPPSGQRVNPVCDRFCRWFSCRLCRQPTWPGWPMKSSSAWLTSSAWVQMIACGPLGMMVERAFFSNAGSLRLVAS